MAERALGEEEPAGTASQRRLIRDHLLPNFAGFELLPAPYAIAHLKLASFYEQFGYRLGSQERVSIYLTNSERMRSALISGLVRRVREGLRAPFEKEEVGPGS